MPLNYIPKAIEDIKKFIKYPSITAIDRAIGEEITDLLDRSVKFDLPVNANLIGKEQMKKILDLKIFNLPFPITALQYPSIAGASITSDPTKLLSPKRIALSFYDTELDSKSALSYFIKSTVPCLSNCPYIGTVSITSQEVEPILPEFMSIMFMIITPLDVTVVKNNPNMDWIEVAPEVHTLLVPLYPEMVKGYIERIGPKQALNNGWADVIEEYSATAEFMCTLACNNVSILKETANSKINKKRLKKGKNRLYDSNFITIKVSKASSITTGDAKRKNASPTPHLRRGHIRHLPSGKMTWIPVMMIGANPGTQKDYLILK